MGGRVAVSGVWDDEEEARTIGEDIEALRKAGQQPRRASPSWCAPRSRCAPSRTASSRSACPTASIGGPRFYERQEIKDAIAYLEVTLNPANDLKFERIVNVPKRGLGDTAVQARQRAGPGARHPALSGRARDRRDRGADAAGRARRSPISLAAFERWRGQIDGMKHTELAELILDESGYTQMWQNDKSPQAHSRLENLKELIRFMHEFETLQGFLEHVSLVMDADTADGGDRVSLMTLHAAKGLEFDVVFLPGWEEGLFPHQRSLDESGPAGLEEERRLAYVGLTRARRQAKVSFAQNRRNRGLWQAAAPSRFVDELPEAQRRGHRARRAPTAGRSAVPAGFNPYGRSRFDEPAAGFQSGYATPGWQRAKEQWSREDRTQDRARPMTLEGELVASSTGQRLELRARRARVPPEVRLRRGGRGRRQQAHHRFRQGRPQARGRQLRGAGGGLIGARRFLPARLREQPPPRYRSLSALYASLLRFT